MNFQDIFNTYLVEAKLMWNQSKMREAYLQKKADFFRTSYLVNNIYVLNLAKQYSHTQFVKNNFQLIEKKQRKNEQNQEEEQQE